MANPLKVIEQGISAGDWSKVVKGFNLLTGKKVSEPSTTDKVTKKGRPAKKEVVTKTKTVIEYVTDTSLLDILKFYQDNKNYQLNNGRIEVLLDGGEKARTYKPKTKPSKIVEDDTEQTENLDKDIKVIKPKKSKVVSDEDDFFSPNYKPKPILIEAKGDDPHPSIKYPKNRVKEYRDSDTSQDIIEHKCDKCSKMKPFRRWETQKEIKGKRMDTICNDCNKGR